MIIAGFIIVSILAITLTGVLVYRSSREMESTKKTTTKRHAEPDARPEWGVNPKWGTPFHRPKTKFFCDGSCNCPLHVEPPKSGMKPRHYPHPIQEKENN